MLIDSPEKTANFRTASDFSTSAKCLSISARNSAKHLSISACKCAADSNTSDFEATFLRLRNLGRCRLRYVLGIVC